MSMKPLDIQAFNEWRTNMHQSTWGWERAQAHAAMIGEAAARIMMYKTDKPAGDNGVMLDNARTETGKILLQTLALCQAVGLDPQALVHERIVNNSIRWAGKFPIPAETIAEMVTRPELMRSEAFVTAFKMYYQFGSACTDTDARDITLNMMLNAAGVRELTNVDIDRLEVTHGVNRPTMLRVMPEGGYYEGTQSGKHRSIETSFNVRLSQPGTELVKHGDQVLMNNSPDHFVYIGNIDRGTLTLEQHYFNGTACPNEPLKLSGTQLESGSMMAHVTFTIYKNALKHEGAATDDDVKQMFVDLKSRVIAEINGAVADHCKMRRKVIEHNSLDMPVIDLPAIFGADVRKKIDEIPTVLPLDLRRDGADKTFSVGHSKAADISAQYYIEVAKGRAVRDPADYKLDVLHWEEIEQTKPHPFPAGQATPDPYFGMHPNAAEKLILRNFTDTFTCNPTLTLPTLPDAEDSVLRDAEFCHQLGAKLEGRPLPLVIKYADLHGLPYFSIYPQQWRGCGAEDGNFWFPEDVRELEVGDIHMRLISAAMVDFLATNAGAKAMIRMADTIADVKSKVSEGPRKDLERSGSVEGSVSFEVAVTKILKERHPEYRIMCCELHGVRHPEGWSGMGGGDRRYFDFSHLSVHEAGREVIEKIEAFVEPYREHLRNLK